MPGSIHHDVDRVLTIREVAQYLQVSRSTLYRLMPTFPIVQLSAHRVGVRASDLARWQEQRVRQPYEVTSIKDGVVA